MNRDPDDTPPFVDDAFQGFTVDADEDADADLDAELYAEDGGEPAPLPREIRHHDMDAAPEDGDDLAAIDSYIDDLLGDASPTPWTALVDVQVLLLDSGRVLLVHRTNTGFCDDMWGPPTGRLRALESVLARAAREAKDVFGVRVTPEALHFAHVIHYRSDSDRFVFVFTTQTWEGEPVNRETHEHSALAWFPLDDLPANTLPATASAIAHYRQGRSFSLLNWWW